MPTAPSPARKRIALLTYGSRGDVEPFVALGVALRAAGHTVRLAAPAPFAPLVAGRGLEFIPIEGDPEALARAFADRAGLNWARMITQMARHVFPLARSAIGAVETAAADADLIVHSFLLTDGGHSLAERMGIPDVSAQFFPVFLTTSAFPAVALPDLPLGGLYRRGTHAVNTAVFRHGGRLMYRRLRRSSPNLPHLARWPFEGGATPILFAYSAHVLPFPPDWPPYAHITGYWSLPPPQGWVPPAPLVRFLHSGPAPLYFGPGSMRGERLREVLETVIVAARACGQRTVLGLSPSEVPARLAGEDVITADGVPHSWLFPRMGFILHHGGAGTTGAAAASGVPSTAIPFSGDQAFWARRMARLGVGPAAPSAPRLKPARLEGIVRDGFVVSEYRLRAKDLAARIAQEDGVAAAAEIIQDSLVAK